VKSVEEQQPINYVRRRERAVEDDAWIRGFLREAQYGVVATECDGQPFMNPLIFVYDEAAHAIYFHTGRKGRIFANVTANPRVCFNACKMLGLISQPEAFRFDVAYESVIVFGRVRIVEEEAEATAALRALLDKYFPHLRYGEDYTPITAGQLKPVAVQCLQIESWSGKRNHG